MRVLDFLKGIKSPKLRLAWLVAIAADAIQIVALPLFVPGGLSPLDVVLDAAAAVVLIELLGWHWAFLPTLAAELVPAQEEIDLKKVFARMEEIRKRSKKPKNVSIKELIEEGRM